MRGLKAKRLRRQAEVVSVGLPLVSYVWKQDARGNRNIILSDCTRSICQDMKRASV